LSISRLLRPLHLLYFSKPAFNRPLYRAIRRLQAKKIVELGVGDAKRGLRMIKTAQFASLSQNVHYVGIDRFEDRTDQNRQAIGLKEAYQLLRTSGAKVQLVPGNPPDALIALANSLGKIDVLIVPAELDWPSSARVWLFVPRMLHEQSLVFIDEQLTDGGRRLRLKSREEIDMLAAAAARRRAA
jgi:hypothetical protein